MTSLSISEQFDTVSNPLDLVEQVVAANDWAFDRRSDSDMAAEAPGNGAITGSIFAGRTKSPSCISPAPSI